MAADEAREAGSCSAASCFRRFAVMLMIIIVGMVVEALFGVLDRRIRSKRGLLATT